MADALHRGPETYPEREPGHDAGEVFDEDAGRLRSPRNIAIAFLAGGLSVMAVGLGGWIAGLDPLKALLLSGLVTAVGSYFTYQRNQDVLYRSIATSNLTAIDRIMKKQAKVQDSAEPSPQMAPEEFAGLVRSVLSKNAPSNPLSIPRTTEEMDLLIARAYLEGRLAEIITRMPDAFPPSVKAGLRAIDQKIPLRPEKLQAGEISETIQHMVTRSEINPKSGQEG